MYNKECVLYDRECIDCGECERCDLDATKICDNCGKCIEPKKEYAEIKISKIILSEEENN